MPTAVCAWPWSSELVAGECSYWACVPSKTLLRPGEALAAAIAAAGAREAVTGGVDAAAALAWRDFMSPITATPVRSPGSTARASGLLRGDGRIAGANRVGVGSNEYSAEHIVVSTGSAPFSPPIPGRRELDGVWTNRDATGVRELPRRLLVLGGGPVGVELAQALARMGVSVALVEGADSRSRRSRRLSCTR